MANAKYIQLGNAVATMHNTLSGKWVTESVTLAGCTWDIYEDAEIDKDEWERIAEHFIKHVDNPDTAKSRKTEYKAVVTAAAFDYVGAIATAKRLHKKQPSRELALAIARLLPTMGCEDLPAVVGAAVQKLTDKKTKKAERVGVIASPEQVLVAAFKTIRETETTNRDVIEWRAKHGASIRKLIESLTAE